MPNYVFYDKNGLIYKKKRSISSHLIEEGLIPGYERTVKVDDINTITKYHIVDNGVIREMTQAERDTLDQAEAAAQAQVEEQAIQDLRLTMKEVLTALVQCINKRIPQDKITHEELVTQIKSNR